MDYYCDECDEEFEDWECHGDDGGNTVCPVCGAIVEKVEEDASEAFIDTEETLGGDY